VKIVPAQGTRLPVSGTLLDKGVFTVLSIRPGRAPRQDLIRTAVSAMHQRLDLEKIAPRWLRVQGSWRFEM